MCTKPPQLSTVWLSSVEPQGKVWTSFRFSSSALSLAGQTLTRGGSGQRDYSALAHCVLAVYCLCTSCVLLVYQLCTEKPDTRCSDKRFLSNTDIALTAVQNTVYIRTVVSLKSYYKCTVQFAYNNVCTYIGIVTYTNTHNRT